MTVWQVPDLEIIDTIMDCLFLRPDVWCFWLPVFCPTALWLRAARSSGLSYFTKSSCCPPEFYYQLFFLNHLMPQILTERWQRGQGVVLGTENKGDEKCWLMIMVSRGPRCIFTSALFSRGFRRCGCSGMSKNAFIWRRRFGFSQILSPGDFFPAVSEICKHQTFTFIPTRGQCVTMRFSFLLNQQSANSFNLVLIILEM